MQGKKALKKPLPSVHQKSRMLSCLLYTYGANQKAAGKEGNKVVKSWKKDNKKSGYGKYAETNVSEFWAETVTKAIHGKSYKPKIRKQSQWQSQLQ